MKKLIGLSLFITVLMLFSCKEEYNENYQAEASNPEYLHRSMKRLTDVIVHNIFSPPVASRVYAYPSIAAYEVMAQGDSIYKSLEGQLTDFKNVPKPIDSKEYCFPLASVQAFLTASKVFIFTEKDITDFENELLAEFKAIKMPRKVYERSIAYGNEMAAHIIEWSKSDMYAETRTYSKYALTDDEGKWEPTPPDFMDGIEPHWREIRPFVLDSAQQFIPVPPTAFSKEKNSLFYKEAMEAYEKGKKYPETQLGSLSDETKENIAIA